MTVISSGLFSLYYYKQKETINPFINQHIISHAREDEQGHEMAREENRTIILPLDLEVNRLHRAALLRNYP